jgi:class 3 adenylate cyclase/tetratricopeptide (TPR) repeat protein
MVNQARLHAAGEASLIRFFPGRLGARLAARAESPTETWFDGACLCADIVGFTELTERLAHRGEQGLEQLADLLTPRFAEYVESVRRSGGEVVEFAGDALVAYFAASGPGDLSRAVHAATDCAQRITGVPADSGSEIPALHTGIGAGRLWAARIGNLEAGLELVLGGPAVRDAVVAQKLSARGEVLIAPAASAWLEADKLAGHKQGHGLLRQAAASDLDEAVPPSSDELPLAAWPMGMVPRVVQERWNGYPGSWLSELRQVTPVFVRIHGLDPDAPDALARLQEAASSIHDVVAAFSLERGRLLLDDAGLVFLLVFGVPYNTHADDISRAMRAALAIERRLAALGFACAAGVASGPAYCGVLGSAARSEYAVIGPPMNRAARLMTTAEQGVLCPASLETWLAQPDLAVTEVGELSLKGVEGLRALRVRSNTPFAETTRELAGRVKEQEQLETLLDELADGKGAVLSVVGEAGLGKTTLVMDLAERARRRGFTSTWARADPEVSTSFGVFRQVLAAFFELPRDLGSSELEGELRERLARRARPEAIALLSWLLNPGRDSSADVPGSAWRADATLELLTDTLRDLAPTPSVIVLEDVQWLDSASFRLAERVARLLPGLLLVLTSRSRSVPGLAPVLAASPRSHRIELQALDERASAELAQRLLGGRPPGNDLLALIRKHSRGNPLYIVECLLLLGAKEQREGGSHVVEPEPGSGISSLRGLITNRLDRLSPDDALAVRVASVVGTVFEWSLVERLLSKDRGPSSASISSLVRERIVVPVDADERSFRFSHDLFRAVAYDLMLVQRRRALHAEAARLLEENRPRAAAATLARHWQRAGDDERTLYWSDRAGSEALDLGAFEEASEHFERCLELHAEAQSPFDALRWRRKLSDACAGLGALGRRAEHARLGLALAGETPREAHKTSLPRAMADFTHFLVRSRQRGPVGTGSEVAALYRHLAHIAYFESDGLGLFAHTLRAVHAAQTDVPSAALCGALAELGGALGLGGLHGLGMKYLERALRTAEGLEHPQGAAYVNLVQSLYLVGRGEWADSEASAERCQGICEKIRDPINWGNAQIVRFWGAYYRGQSALAESLSAGLLSRARRTGNVQHETWALRGLGLLRLRQGVPAAALPGLESALANARERDVNELMPTQAALALSCLKLGQRERALSLARTALALAERMERPTGHAILSGLSALAEVAFAASEREPEGRELVERVLERLDAYRKVFPIGVPAHYRFRATQAERRGHTDAANKLRAQAAAAADRLGMTRE